MSKSNETTPNVPTLRFKRYTTEWTKINLSNYLFVSSKRNKDGRFSKEDVLSVSGELGIVNQIALLGRSYAGESVLPYHIVEKGDIVYTKSPLALYPYGIIKTNRNKVGIVSTLYAVYKTKDNANNRFIEHYFSLKSRINNYLKPIVRIGAKHDMKIGNNEVLENIVAFPDISEQCEIADFLDLLDNRISVQNKIISDLKVLKKELCNRYFKSVHNDTSLEYVTLKDILTERKEYCSKDGTYTHGTLSKEGVSPKTERYDRDFLVKNEDKQYKVTHFNDICYNPANLKFGVICRNTYGDLIFSPIYVTFEIADTVYPAYIELFLTNANFIGRIRRYEQGTVYERMAVSSEDFLSYETRMPTYEEQVKFADKIQRIQDKIELETLFLNYLQKQRKYLLIAMFI